MGADAGVWMAVRAELLRPGFKGAESMRTAAPADAGAALTVLTSFAAGLATGAAIFLTDSPTALAAVADTGFTAVCADVLVFFSGAFTQYLLWEPASGLCPDHFFA